MFKTTTKLNIRYNLTDEFVQQQYVATGERKSEIKVDLVIDTPERRELELAWRQHKLPTGGFANQGLGNVVIGTAFPTNVPQRQIQSIKYDHILTEDEVIAEMRRMIEEAELIEPKLEAVIAEHKQEIAEKSRRMAEQREAELTAAKAEREAKLAAAAVIDWNKETGKSIVNLRDAVAAASGNMSAEWVKEVTGINYKSQNGYMYEGEFVNNRKVEIDRPATRRVYIVNERLNKRSTRYHVVALENGVLTKITTEEDDRNWALNLRDTIAGLLPKSADEAKPRTITATDEEWMMVERIAKEQGMSVSSLLMKLAKAADETRV